MLSPLLRSAAPGWRQLDQEQPPRAEPPPERPSHRLRLLVAAAFTLGWAGLCTAALDMSGTTAGFGRAVRNLLDQPPAVFALSTLVVWVLLLGLVAVVGRVLVAAGLAGAITTALAYANHEKLVLRQEPLYPSDLAFVGESGFLIETVGVKSLVGSVLVGAGLIWGGLVVAREVRRRLRVDRPAEPVSRDVQVVGRLAMLVAATLLVSELAHFNATGNLVRRGYEAAGATWASYSQRTNYVRNGLLAGMLYNVSVPAMVEPEGYSAAEMRRIAERYAAEARAVNATRTGSLDDVNVVVVLGEAFSDPTLVRGVQPVEDPIPFTRQLMSRTVSGSLLTQLVGAGTANMEFEVLTGLSLAMFLPQLTTPYQMLVAGQDSFPSVARWLRDRGHQTLAVHPYGPRMYKRDVVFPAFGIDRFVYDELMQQTGRVGGNPLIADDAAFREVEAELAASDEPMFVQLTTMQNHYPYAGKYDDPVPVVGGTRQTAAELGGYARGLRHSDRALRDWLRRLRASEEKTAVLFYGDHTPSFWNSEPAAAEQQLTLRQTPFFLWTNYRDLPSRRLGLTSGPYLLPLLFEALDVPEPPLFTLLRDLHREVPAMQQGLLLTGRGTFGSPEDLDERGRQLLHDYRMVQYDLAVGERYSLETLLG